MFSGPRIGPFRTSGLLALAALLVTAAATVPCAADPSPPNSFTIPAWAFDRGNIRVFPGRGDVPPMVASSGQSPLTVEYDVDFPATATYGLSLCFASATVRSVEVWLDGRRVGTGCQATTCSFSPAMAIWEEACKLDLTQGKHTIKLQREKPFPHVVSLRFDSSAPLPKDWKLQRPTARTLPQPADAQPKAARAKAARPKAAAVGSLPPGVANTQQKADLAALRRAIDDLTATFGPRYPNGARYLQQLDALEKQQAAVGSRPGAEADKVQEALAALRREALLANPLLDFDKLLLVKRSQTAPALGLPRNWQSNSSLAKTGYDDSIEVLSPVRPQGRLTTLFRPQGGRFVGDVDLHFHADRMLFSMPGKNGRWQVCEIRADGSGLRELTGDQPDVDSYDACYLPDGRILFTSTACFVGVPCVYGSAHATNSYLMDADGRHIRQITFDQEHNWCPTVLNNGRVLYSRWEYTDTPHSNTRLLFHMNPDGTEQTAYLGSNSYWPNSFFYARPVPGHPTKVVAVIGGHHDHPRMGELVVFDPAQGRHEAEGAVQRIPGYGRKVEPIIRDGLTTASWPKFLHPYPLSEKYFLVSCKPTPRSLWGLYLVDVFDNLLLIKETADYALLEPIPFRPTPVPPVIPDKTDPSRSDALVYLPDVYAGDGLKGVPRGTVKSLRLFTYHFAYQGMGGLLGVVGADGPWDIKRVLGTVPVEKDGSARFRIPANTPISIQPLDEEGQALQLMRSWTTAMPGEVVTCMGCHESPNSAPHSKPTLAQAKRPAEIRPWYGPLRGFSYAREVQPVIDKYCVGCHNGQPGERQNSGTGPFFGERTLDLPNNVDRKHGPVPLALAIPNLRGDVRVTDWKSVTPGNGGGHAGKFSVGYVELCRYVRRPGIESDYHLLEPMEFHAGTTDLVQMLKKGHYNVQLDAEAWDRLVTWIDLNCPFHGTWGEEIANTTKLRTRRRELLKLYANVDDDPEAVPTTATAPVKPVLPPPVAPVQQSPACPGWPFDASEARRRQSAAAPVTRQKIDLGGGMCLELTLIPAGQFVLGSAVGEADERPLTCVRIERPFWLGVCEVSNQQYARFDPRHDSRVEDKNAYQFGIHGYPMNRPEQPVVRVSWSRAMDFCRWLSERTGRRFSLPTEAQWEYACRAGTASPMFYGDLDTDFSTFANLADAKLSEFASNPYTVDQPLKNPTKYDDWLPKDPRFNDGALLSIAPGHYRPNAWGLYDMHGNVAEWTRTTYRPYPYATADGRDAGQAEGRKVVRGGSWHDVPKRCTSSFRLSYLPYQAVYNVGFRVMCEADAPVAAGFAEAPRP